MSEPNGKFTILERDTSDTCEDGLGFTSDTDYIVRVCHKEGQSVSLDKIEHRYDFNTTFYEVTITGTAFSSMHFFTSLANLSIASAAQKETWHIVLTVHYDEGGTNKRRVSTTRYNNASNGGPGGSSSSQ